LTPDRALSTDRPISRRFLVGTGVLVTMFGTYLAPSLPGPSRPPQPRDPESWDGESPPVPMNRTYLALEPDPELTGTAWRTRGATTDEPDILGSRTSRPPDPTVHPYITMHRTYLARGSAFSGRSTLAILETYEACVHHDAPDIFGACTHDVPDILLPMNRTYLGRALTMNRTYHYR
jgi:hypothetical protein